MDTNSVLYSQRQMRKKIFVNLNAGYYQQGWVLSTKMPRFARHFYFGNKDNFIRDSSKRNASGINPLASFFDYRLTGCAITSANRLMSPRELTRLLTALMKVLRILVKVALSASASRASSTSSISS